MTIPSLRVAIVCLTLTHLPFTYTYAHFYTLTEINTFKWDCTRVRVMLLSLLMPAFMLHVRVCVSFVFGSVVTPPPPPSLLVIVKEQKPKNSEG